VCAGVLGISEIGKWHFRGWKMAFLPSHYGIFGIGLWHFGKTSGFIRIIEKKELSLHND
jgi:hypothetical protein